MDGVSPLARWLALDLIVVGYVVATVAVVLLGHARIPGATRIALLHVGGLFVYALLRRGSTKSRLFRALFFLSLFALVLSIFEGMGAILPHLRADAVADLKTDAALAQADLLLFGSDPTTWFESALTPLTVLLLQICYTSYFFLPAILAVLVLSRRQYRSFLSYAAVIIGCFFTTYVGYYLVPAYGPRFYYDYPAAIPRSAVSQWLHETIDVLDLIKLNAFPSGHTSVTIVYLAILFREDRRIAWFCLPLVVGLIIATVALRYHYLIDVVAGVLCAALWVPWGMRAVFRFDSGKRGRTRTTAPDSS